MTGSVRNFGALIWRVTNGGGRRGKVILQKTKQTNKWLFFAQKL
jgi:hypothetical protein